jgi:mono/diheme cytochrome c family protein
MGRRVSQAVVAALVCGCGVVTIGCRQGDVRPPDPSGPWTPADAAAPDGPPVMGAVLPAPVVMPSSLPDAAPEEVAPAPAAPPLPPPPVPVAASGDMPADVANLLRTRCAGCHAYGIGDPAGWGSVLDVSRMIDADIVVPGAPDESRMIDRVAVLGNMPPKGPRLTSEEVALLRGWITSLKRAANEPPSDNDVLDLVARDQLALRDRSSDFRYVSFAHQAGQGRPDGEMKTTAQVLGFVLNSLSRRGAIADFPTIDPAGSIFRIDLAQLGWNAQVWDQLTSFYPYCLTSDVAAHQALYKQLGTEAPVVRGDWLLATATKAPLYDLLLDLPNTVDQLANRLGININDDINHPGKEEPDNLVRVGFRRSGVALHNRMLERHLGAAGQYLWISYDFDSSQGNQDLLNRPLGPANRDRQRFVHTFEHVAGEVIFSLPNGLQGYMIVDAAGRKLSAASLKVVRDPYRRDGVVTNGLSCFGCHGGAGLLQPRQMDEVPVFAENNIAQFQGRELLEIASLYPKPLRPDPFAADAARYRALASGSPGGAPPEDNAYGAFIAALGQYESNVGFHGAAAEFNQEYKSLRATIQANDSQNDSLPATLKEPLVLRDDFVCVWRDLVTKIRPNAVFCDKTFEAAAVRNSCR